VTRGQKELQESGDDPVIKRLDDLSAELDAIRADIARIDGRP
jgi:hypothetical protein